MPDSRIILYGACLLIVLAGFYAGLEALVLRHEAEDYYPEYSSFRADPMGLRALHGALERMPGLHVERNRLPLDLYDLPPDATVILAGATTSPDPVPFLKKIEAFMDAGGRLVIANGPCNKDTGYCWEEIDGEDGGDESEVNEDIPEFARSEWASARWGFDFEVDDEHKQQADAVLLKAGEETAGGTAFPKSIRWNSQLYFKEPSAEWRVLYSRNDLPVLMERDWGKGSLVIASDSYFLSNEAMRKHRSTGLLAWLVGPHARVIFDEAHLGIASAPGLVDLIFRLRLQGILIALGLCGALFAWMGLVGHAPRRESTALELAPQERGREAFSGLVALLRRSVPQHQLLTQCRLEWERAAHLLSPRARARAAEVARLAAQTGNEPEKITETYRLISQWLQEKR